MVTLLGMQNAKTNLPSKRRRSNNDENRIEERINERRNTRVLIPSRKSRNARAIVGPKNGDLDEALARNRDEEGAKREEKRIEERFAASMWTMLATISAHCFKKWRRRRRLRARARAYRRLVKTKSCCERMRQ